MLHNPDANARLTIHGKRLHRNSLDWVLTHDEELRATIPCTVFEELMLQTYRGLNFDVQRVVLADAISKSINPKNAAPNTFRESDRARKNRLAGILGRAVDVDTGDFVPKAAKAA